MTAAVSTFNTYIIYVYMNTKLSYVRTYMSIAMHQHLYGTVSISLVMYGALCAACMTCVVLQ